jgi:long-subunit acyl-CoA synthetase (AMP-forming)
MRLVLRLAHHASRNPRRAIRADARAGVHSLHSGTTGRAKGVLLTVHGMLWIVAACWAPITA